MTALYVPPTEEADHKKQNMSLQLIGGQTTTNTTNIATNTANIASNTAAISTLQAGPLVSGAVAAQSDQETATSTTLAVTPGRQQFHPSASKAWVCFTGSGTNGAQTIDAGYNVASVSRTALGIYTVTFTTSFSSANFSCHVTAEGVNGWGLVSSKLAGSVSIIFESISAGTLVALDPTHGHLVAFGDQ